MKHAKQLGLFESDLRALVSRYIDEFDLPLASIVGALHIQAHEVIQDAREAEADEEK